MDGFTAIRIGILEHIEAGEFSPNDFTVYMYLHLRQNWASAICYSNAVSIATVWNMSVSTVKDCLRRLRERGFIDYPEGTGTRGNYPILILKSEPTSGVLKNTRLISRSNNDFQAAVYEFPSCDRLEAVRSAAAQHPDTVLWTACDRLLTVPLQDLQNRSKLERLKNALNPHTPKRRRGGALARGVGNG